MTCVIKVIIVGGVCGGTPPPTPAAKALHGAQSENRMGQVHTLGGFSAHAGQTDLLTWFSAIAPCKPRVVLTHGEDEPRDALAKKIQQRFKLLPKLPQMGEVIEL